MAPFKTFTSNPRGIRTSEYATPSSDISEGERGSYVRAITLNVLFATRRVRSQCRPDPRPTVPEGPSWVGGFSTAGFA